MAIYGVDFYGLSKYGSDLVVEYDVSPFVATPVDYDNIRLSWTMPGGDVTRLRLLRNRYGYSIWETDGDVILDTAFIPEDFVDTGVPSGVPHYYTIFVLLNGSWVRAGVASTLSAADKGYSDRLYYLLPEYFRYGTRALDETVVENEQLRSFMQVFGWGFDYLATYYGSLLNSHDADTVSVQNLERLAGDLGITYEHAIPARLMRQRVKYSGHLARQKGTLEGLRNLINATVGWDADLKTGPNLLLNNHQASFVFPQYEDYSALVNYPKGDRVRFTRYVYEAVVGTYGNQPSGARSDTAYWHCLGDADTATAESALALNPSWYVKSQNSATGGISTWETLSLTAGVTGTSAVRISSGLPDPSDLTAETRNALYVQNTHATLPGDFVLRSVSRLAGQSGMDPSQPIKDGIPMRRVLNYYDNTVTYEAGDLVLYHGRTFRARKETVGITPPLTSSTYTSNEWESAGIDSRIQHALSGFTHQPPSYVAKPTVAVTPYVDYYDETGNLIVSVDGQTYAQVKFDPFTWAWGAFATGRTLDVGAGTWTVSGTWATSGYKDGAAFPTSTAAAKTATLAGAADGQVAVTFRSDAPSGVNQGIIFRQSDASNYWLATRTALIKKVAGSPTTVGTYSTACQKDDRLTVKMQGSVITVMRNGVTVLTVTDSFNSTSTSHGMAVNA